MICKYCGANFRRENLIYCPYCDMEIPADDTMGSVGSENKEGIQWNLNKLTEKHILATPNLGEICGTVKVTIKGNKNMLSPATGSNYVMSFDDGEYLVRLTKGDNDVFESIELPVGSHQCTLSFYSWRDTNLENPDSSDDDMIMIDVKENAMTEIVVRTGAVFTSRKIDIIYR